MIALKARLTISNEHWPMALDRTSFGFPSRIWKAKKRDGLNRLHCMKTGLYLSVVPLDLTQILTSDRYSVSTVETTIIFSWSYQVEPTVNG